MARPGFVALMVVVGMLFTYSCAQQGKTPPSEHQQKVNESEHQQQEQIPSTARIECFRQEGEANGDSYTQVVPSTVAAQPDGVHIRFDNRLGEGARYFTEARAPDEPPLTPPTGVPVPKGKSNQVADFPPGLTEIACTLPGYLDSYSYEFFEVVEGDSGYKSLELECKPGAVPHIAPFIHGAAGISEYRDPVKEAREDLKEGLKEGDVVEEAGYPEDPSPHVRVVRNGKVIATIDFDFGLTFCEGQNF